jgi:hypothetical protein
LIGNADVTTTGSVSFFDENGTSVFESGTRTILNNTLVVASNFVSPGVSVVFSEIRARFRFDGFSNYSLGGPPSGANFDQPKIYFISVDRIVVPGPLDPIPEPSTWALLISGFGMAGAMLRRRRAAVAT